MKRNRFSEEQIIGILKEHEAGISVADLCRTHGVSDATVYKWKAKFGGMDVSEAKRLKVLEDENARLKRLLADAMLDNAALKDLLGKKMVTPSAKRQAVAQLVANHKMSERRACRVIGCCRMSVRYKTVRQDDPVLRDRLNALAKERRRFGYRRLHVFLRREGHEVNHKRLFRIYREEGLHVRRRGGRKRAIGTRAPVAQPLMPNQRWSLDFVSDQMTDGRRFRILTDRRQDYNNERPHSRLGWRTPAEFAQTFAQQRGLPLRNMTSYAPATVAQTAHMGKSNERSLAQVG